MAACILWGRCPLITGASARLYLWAAAHHSPVGLPTGRHTLSGAAAPSLPGPLPHHYQGRSPPCSSLVCQQGCTLSLGPLPHHYQGPSPTLSQGRSPPWAHWFANRDARTLMAHGPSTARASAGLLSEPHSPLWLLWVCHQGVRPHQACLSQGRSLPDLVWPILRFGYIVRPLPYHGYSPNSVSALQPARLSLGKRPQYHDKSLSLFIYLWPKAATQVQRSADRARHSVCTADPPLPDRSKGRCPPRLRGSAGGRADKSHHD